MCGKLPLTPDHLMLSGARLCGIVTLRYHVSGGGQYIKTNCPSSAVSPTQYGEKSEEKSEEETPTQCPFGRKAVPQFPVHTASETLRLTLLDVIEEIHGYFGIPFFLTLRVHWFSSSLTLTIPQIFSSLTLRVPWVGVTLCVCGEGGREGGRIDGKTE